MRTALRLYGLKCLLCLFVKTISIRGSRYHYYFYSHLRHIPKGYFKCLMVFNRSIKRLTQTNTMNWFLKTFISLISLVPSGMWKRPEVDQTHEKSPKTNDTRYRGGTLRLMVVHYLAPGCVFGPEACERVWRLQMSCLHLWHQQFFFWKKKNCW